MHFIIDGKLFETFPGLLLGILVAKNINNTGVLQELQTELRDQEMIVRKQFSTETLSQQPKIDAWRKAYVLFGAKPKEHKSSVENLYRMVLQGKDIRHINTLVDIYNLISLKHMLPAGAEDLDAVRGTIELTLASRQEPPVLLLGDKEARPPHEGEVIYKDRIGRAHV